jgi:hypothetical protein
LQEKENLHKASKICCIAILGLLLASLGAAVYAEVGVYIRNPLNTSNNAEGVISGSYWVGEIPITVSGEPDQQARAYCMNFDKTVYVGNTYPAELAAVADTPEWRAVSYILTWYNPPADGNAAATNQVAIWRILNGTRGYNYVKPDWLSQSLDDAGNTLAEEVKNKDVVRQDDVFQWIEPVTTNESAVMGNPGETITFKAQITDLHGNPRSGVRVLFTAVLGADDVELDPVMTHTDSNGIACVNVKVPEDIQNGERVEVEASTKSVWPQLYLDLNDDKRQDLIGMGTCYELTVSTNVCVLAYIMVIPEVPLGTITAGAACAFAFVFWKKGGHLKKQKIK